MVEERVQHVVDGIPRVNELTKDLSSGRSDVSTLLAVEAVSDGRLEDALHLRLALIIRRHLARNQDLTGLKGNLRR